MLFMSSANKIFRIHGPYVSESEIEKVNSFLRSQGEPDYIDEITAINVGEKTDSLSLDGNDELIKLRKVFNSKVNIRLKEKDNGTILFPFTNITEFKTLIKKLNAKK